jgi:integrase
VPVGHYIRPFLAHFATLDALPDTNIFTGADKPYSEDFFKGLWTKYKRQSKLLEKDQTLYSLRHTGAIRVYEKTGSLVKLQQVLGHSSLQVSLTYLRGLEVQQMKLDDMPSL